MNRSRSCSNLQLIFESATSITARPTGVAKITNCGVVRFAGRGIEFNVYEKDGNAYIQADLVQPVIEPVAPIPPIEIDEIVSTPQGVRVQGKAFPFLGIKLIRLGTIIRQIIADQQGNFVIDGLENGIYRLEGDNGSSAVIAITGEENGM